MAFLHYSPIISLIFIYSIVGYRLFYRKENKHIIENLGLLLISIILIFGSSLSYGLKVLFYVISALLVGSTIYKHRGKSNI